MIKVKVILECSKRDFEMALNTELIELQNKQCEIVDIKYQTSAYGEYTTLIMYKGAGNEN